MQEMTFTNEYFSQRIFELRAALREMDGFEPVKGISENVGDIEVKGKSRKASSKTPKAVGRRQQRVNTK